jgi:solute carrier family 35 protein E1
MITDKINFYSNVLVWFGSSYIFTIGNKKMLTMIDDSNFLFPIGILQLGISVVYGICYLIITDKKIIMEKKINFIKYIGIGIVSILCHLSSIFASKSNSIITYQIIKATEPIFNIFLQYLLFDDIICWNKIFFIGLIIFGGILSSVNFNNNHNITFELDKFGLAYGLISNLFSSIKTIAINKFIKSNIKNNSINMVKSLDNSKLNLYDENSILFEYILTNTFTLLIGLPIWYFFGINNIILLKNKLLGDYNIIKYLISSGISFYFFNYYSVLIINQIDLFGQIVLGVLKKILIIIISLIFFNEQINLIKIIGIVICLSSIIVDFLLN